MFKKINPQRSLKLVLFFCVIGCTSHSFAQSEAELKGFIEAFGGGVKLLDEIVVTARKREQSAQEVGIAMTVLSHDYLKELGISDSSDLVDNTPNLEFSGAGGGTLNTFSIRGVTQNDFSAAQESPVAVYVDDVYLSQNTVTGFSLFDIERVEVLRGPQGTLFGRNATGGLVHFVSVRPDQILDGYVDVELGDANRRRIEGAIGSGLTDSVSGRLSFVSNKRDGLIENDIGPDLMDANDYAIRGQLFFDPLAPFTMLIKAQYADEDSRAGGYSHRSGQFGRFVDGPDDNGYQNADGDPFTGSYNFDGFKKATVEDYSIQVETELGNSTLTSISNFQDIQHRYAEDSDASPVKELYYFQDDSVAQFSQEFRVSWSSDYHESLVGFYYLDIDANLAVVQSGEFLAGAVERNAAEQQTSTWALFGHTELALSEQLALIVGLRFNTDNKDYRYNSTDVTNAGPDFFEGEFDDEDFSGKLQLEFSVSDSVLFYGGVSRGIKAGGFNMPLSPLADLSEYPFDGEVLTAFEAGVKSKFGSSRLNASLFYYDYDDYQAYALDGTSTFLFNANARSKGLELEFATNPIDGLELSLGASLLDATIRVDELSGVTFSGTTDPVLAPDLTLNWLLRYAIPAYSGKFFAQLDGSWRDEHSFNLTNTPVVVEGPYAVHNLTFGFESTDERWRGSLFVRNLFDKTYRSYAFDTTEFWGATEDVLGEERWVGASIRYAIQ